MPQSNSQSSEQQWAGERLRLQSIALESAANAIIITDREGRIIWLNPAFTHLTGYTSEEVLGEYPRILKSGEHDPGFYEGLWKTILSGKVWQGETINRRKDGSLYVEEQTITPVRDGRGVISHFISIKQDITQRKEAEEALRQSEEQLRQAQKMEAVGRLAGGMAHDFNNLLVVITGYSELLLQRLSAESSVRKEIEQIRNAAERAESLTSQLLAFSRRQVLQPQVLDLNTVVSNIDKMLRRLIGEDIELLVSLEAALGHVQADPGQLEQVIMNLAVNARDAMPQGGKLTIQTANVDFDEGHVRWHPTLQPGSYVMLAMSDTGCGMNTETLSHIFEPFFTTKGQSKGTGLGLSTVYGIVKQSEGNIEVDSEVGRGSTFRIYLPRIDKAADEHKQPGVCSEIPQGLETILLVEDEEMVRVLVRSILEGNGYTVLEAYHGEEAFSLCERYKGIIHLLLTDVVMPGVSGREVAKRLLLMRPEMKVLYMSGYTDDAIVHHGASDMGGAFIGKPFTPDALACKVRQVLDGMLEERG